MKDVIIVVPLYKDFSCLTQNEILSLQTLNRNLGQYPICCIVPLCLQLPKYVSFFNNNNVCFQRLDQNFFNSVESYNRLCLSKDFYSRFLNYRYMLIYQLDAYVFKDELIVWINAGYDYIGAPYYYDNNQPFDLKTWLVGNGGFSLRSVSQCYRLMKKVKLYSKLLSLAKALHVKKLIRKLLLKVNLVDLSIVEKVLLNKCNEDVFFGIYSKDLMKGFFVAPIEKAIRFSFEAHPSVLFDLNLEELPFGCHAWERYEPEFWSRFIYLQAA